MFLYKTQCRRNSKVEALFILSFELLIVMSKHLINIYGVSSKESEIYIMEVQSDVKRSNFPKVATQLYCDRTRTVN